MTVRIAHPTAHRDQVAAASAHARRILTGSAARGETEIDPHPPRAWLADQFTTLLTALDNGTARLCQHVENGTGPQIVNAAAWLPGTLVCVRCIDLLDPPTDDRGTCDRCHQPAPQLTGSIAACGPLMFAYALCDPCLTG